MPLIGEGEPRQITFLPRARISHSALSPDGSRVAYVSTQSGNGQIWVSNADGSGARQLTNNTSTNFWPFWSPDGRSIAFLDATWFCRPLESSRLRWHSNSVDPQWRIPRRLVA